MEELSLINSSGLDQGTNLYETYLTEFLRVDYFKSEPRTTIYWVKKIRAISEKLKTNGETWEDLLPKELPDELIAEYIENPREVIADGKLVEEEIEELRRPQRIILLYFLKKISGFESQNDQIIEAINNHIARVIFQMQPKKAKPDHGYAIVDTEDISVRIEKGMQLESVIEKEPFTRRYVATSDLVGTTIQLTEMYNSFVLPKKCIGVEKIMVPINDSLAPFRPSKNQEISAEKFQPSITIQSPLLCMREGTRTIDLKLGMGTKLMYDPADFSLQLSTDSGWISIPNEFVSVVGMSQTSGSVSFQIIANSDFPPISPVGCVEVEEEEETDPIPCGAMEMGIRMFHKNADKEQFAVREVELSVMVSGLFPTALRNQDQVIDPKDNYQPFGLDAEPQSIFSFTHPELAQANLREIQLQPTWISKPKNITNYYLAYNKKEEDFRIEISTSFKSEDGVNYTNEINAPSEKVFDSVISFQPIVYPVNVNVPCGSSSEEEVADPLEHSVFFELELTPQGFGVSEYPLLMTNYAIELGTQDAKWIKWWRKNVTPVNMPYVPQWSQLEISYASETVTWSVDAKTDYLRLVLNEPVGYTNYNGEPLELGEDKFGFICLGIDSLSQESTGSIYFNGEVANTNARPAVVNWWYLSSSGWKDFKPFLLIDETNGLTQTGLFNWSIPKDMVNSNTLMPLGKYWLKATIEPGERTVERTCSLSNGGELDVFQQYILFVNGIFTNAISIRRELKELAYSKNVSFLPADSSLSFVDEEVDYGLINPFHTWGEEAAETDLIFWSRAYNRVRNRGRMVAYQDFEDVILREFRDLVLVKCMPRQSGSNRVNIVVINKQFYGTYPYANASFSSVKKLETIQRFVKTKTSPFFQTVIDPNIINPRYVQIGFLVCVIFTDTQLEAENKKRLHEDLQRFVNPWLFRKDEVPMFGKWFDNSSLIAYLQSKPYVEAILNLKMGCVEGNHLRFPEEETFAGDEVLMVSDENTIITLDSLEEFDRLGVGTMEVIVDFIVGIGNEDE